MKKASVATSYKLNTRQSVGVATSYHFLLGVVKDTVKSALEKNGIANSNEVIKRCEAKIIGLQERLRGIDAKFENYPKEMPIKILSNHRKSP